MVLGVSVDLKVRRWVSSIATVLEKCVLWKFPVCDAVKEIIEGLKERNSAVVFEVFIVTLHFV